MLLYINNLFSQSSVNHYATGHSTWQFPKFDKATLQFLNIAISYIRHAACRPHIKGPIDRPPLKWRSMGAAICCHQPLVPEVVNLLPEGGGTQSGKGYQLRSDRWRAVAVVTRDS